jgi:dimethylargininase
VRDLLRFRNAIICPPCDNFSDGLTSVDLGSPDLEKAMLQHRAYCDALRQCGLKLVELDADPRFPDSTFVEDTAIVTSKCAVVMRPGAPSRIGEIESMGETLAQHYDTLHRVQSPGTIDGGDVCQADDHFLIGISERTNEEGARQLSSFLKSAGFTSTHIDIRGVDGILHLKSGISYLGENRMLATMSFSSSKELQGFEIVAVPEGEDYAANCIRVNDWLLLAAGFPKLREILAALGYRLIELEMSEFEKMDGGLSCLSLRF